MRKCLQIIFLFLIYTNYCFSLELTGKVISVTDGDTIKLLTKNYITYKIRLNDIDAPEKKQAFGNKSKENLASYIAGKNIKVTYTKLDKYKRILGTIYYNNLDINLQQIKDGYAWVYKNYSKNQIYSIEENKSRQLKKGLWSDKFPIEPWIFRKQKK